jgi:SAM-dependent methyltransferase
LPDQKDDLTARQRAHWQATYREHPGMYGDEPSAAALYAADLFTAAGGGRVLELGAGHGRDALYFAHRGLTVHATDFSPVGLDQLIARAHSEGLAQRVSVSVQDARDPLAMPDASVDAVFAHMLLCMALSTAQIRALVAEVRRVLTSGGSFIYTVRHTGDAHHGVGVAHGQDIYEHGGFAVHFFSRALVDSLAEGWDLVEVHPFEEGALPRRLWRVTMRHSA